MEALILFNLSTTAGDKDPDLLGKGDHNLDVAESLDVGSCESCESLSA